MPWALHVEMLERSFGQWAEAVFAKFLKRIKALVDLRDRYHLPVNLDAQGFSLAQAVGFRDRNENHILFSFEARFAMNKCSVLSGVGVRRLCRPTLIPAS